MKYLNDIKGELVEAAIAGQYNRSIERLLDYYADEVDGHIQKKLIADIITRYVEVSRQLEERNRQLERSDARRMEAQRTAQLGDWEVDTTLNKPKWSLIMYEILEYPPSMPPSYDAYMRRVHPDDWEMVRQSIEDVNSGKDKQQHRIRLVMDDGRIKWVHLRFSMKNDPQRKAGLIRGTIQDITQDKQIEDQLIEYSTHLEDIVQAKVNEINSTNMATIYALVKLSESRDDDTGNHIERTSAYCKLLATRLREHGVYLEEIDDAFINSITMASPLHDIGKVGIPDAILLKPARLTPEEFEVMKTHVLIGYQTLVGLENRFPTNAFLQFGKDIARYHHEKWDGTGYMEGLSGKDIPLSARIMALGDVYDALRSRRVYKKPYSHEKSVDIIRQWRGTHFDPAVVDVFLAHHEEFSETFERLA